MSVYLRYVLKNIEPLRIADDSTSQSGQTVTLRYIPGTTIRGYIINALAKESDFEQIKKILFSDKVRYLNAFLMKDDRELIPSPKGFYENKIETEGKKKLQNVVVTGEFDEGCKRASIGRYCYMEDDCIHYYHVETGSDMKIKIKLDSNNKKDKQNVFRNEYILPNHIFSGYIALEDENLIKRLQNILNGTIVLGNGRSAGLGKCRVLECNRIDALPYQNYLPKKGMASSCYMLLQSNTVMRNAFGEYCGLDIESLQKKLGVENLEIEQCSTSTVNVRGYNRIWGCKIPSVTMYEMGSVFKLKFQGVLTLENMQNIINSGIGIRRNEGFGRVLLLEKDAYEKISYKLAGEKKKKVFEMNKMPNGKAEDDSVLRIVAKTYYKNQISAAIRKYIVKHPLKKGNISESRLGTLESYAIAYRYAPLEGKQKIMDYLEHSLEKEKSSSVQKDKGSFVQIKQIVETIFQTDLETLLDVATKAADSVMGISKQQLLSEEEKMKYKLLLITELIRYHNKEGEVS